MSLPTEPRSPGPGSPKPYDCLLKFLLVGDSDVGKEELLNGMDNGSTESPYSASSCGNSTLFFTIRKTLYKLTISRIPLLSLQKALVNICINLVIR